MDELGGWHATAGIENGLDGWQALLSRCCGRHGEAGSTDSLWRHAHGAVLHVSQKDEQVVIASLPDPLKEILCFGFGSRLNEMHQLPELVPLGFQDLVPSA